MSTAYLLCLGAMGPNAWAQRGLAYEDCILQVMTSRGEPASGGSWTVCIISGIHAETPGLESTDYSGWSHWIDKASHRTTRGTLDDEGKCNFAYYGSQVLVRLRLHDEELVELLSHPREETLVLQPTRKTKVAHSSLDNFNAITIGQAAPRLIWEDSPDPKAEKWRIVASSPIDASVETTELRTTAAPLQKWSRVRLQAYSSGAPISSAVWDSADDGNARLQIPPLHWKRVSKIPTWPSPLTIPLRVMVDCGPSHHYGAPAMFDNSRGEPVGPFHGAGEAEIQLVGPDGAELGEWRGDPSEADYFISNATMLLQEDVVIINGSLRLPLIEGRLNQHDPSMLAYEYHVGGRTRRGKAAWPADGRFSAVVTRDSLLSAQSRLDLFAMPTWPSCSKSLFIEPPVGHEVALGRIELEHPK